MLFQHLFWFFGHPEVYIVALPFFGVVTEIFPVFSRQPVFGYKGLVLATLAISALSTSVWAHHMFVTGQVVLPFFAATSFLIAVPTGVKVFNWIGTMWGGSLSFEPPMLFALGFLVTFVAGGLTGVMLASPTLDFHLHDTYFVVAHFHYVMGGTVVFALFAAIYFWWPKVTGRMLSSRLGTWHFWLVFVGFNLTFFVMHLLGRDGMPRRVADYPPSDDFEPLEPDRHHRRRRAVRVVRAVLRSTSCARCAGRRRRAPIRGRPTRSSGRRRRRRPSTTSRGCRRSARSGRCSTCAGASTPASARPVSPRSLRDRGEAMRVEMLLWAGVTVYFAVIGAIYWLVDGDPAGASLLLMATALGGLVAGWIWDWRRRHPSAHPRPEDRDDADAGDEVGRRRRLPDGQPAPARPRRGHHGRRARRRRSARG